MPYIFGIVVRLRDDLPIAISKNKKLVNLAGVTLFSLLLHNTFDSISIFFIVVLFVSIETVAYIEEEE